MPHLQGTSPFRQLPAIAFACAALAGCNTPGTPPAAPPAGFSQSSASSPVNLQVNPNELPEPPVVRASGGIASLSLSAQLNPATNLPEFAFAGHPGVAPTIEVAPGDTIRIALTNTLPPAPGMTDDVNLHFHGLTVSPNRPSDDVLGMYARPGATLHYVVAIPRNQEPGLYWYHPHVHGQVNLQAGEAGMSGAIVIDGLEKHLPQLAGMKQRLMIVRETGFVINGLRIANPNAFNNQPCAPENGTTVTLNGAVAPTITMAPGQRQWFRLVNATSHKNLELQIAGQPIQMVAIDGFAYDTYPGNPPVLRERTAIVPPAARAEFVVTAPRSGTVAMKTLCYDSGFTGDRDPEMTLASIVASGPLAPRGSLPPIVDGAPLPANAYTAPLPPPAAKRHVVFSEGGGVFRINGKLFSMNAPPMFVVRTGTTEQWTVTNTTLEVHDFHIHQVHFVVLALDGKKLAHPYWADSIVVPHQQTSGRPGSAVLLLDFRDPVIKGTFVFHCHILDHEDKGMMAKIQAT